ncbi:cytoplasmic protein [Desulfonema magnum]|uniref:Cytoplasmic protein n=1 Tax=Desulfonema magnum TaxID=45655 RepID=A0A975BHR0_9BACT|nr:cytoplasmic protein [Desulfonema magnum]QTA85637.1 Uncharacterized protein dnm_016480 [Desulfonema magnum]
MTTTNRMNMNEIRMDGNNLYREEAYTDLRVGSIRRLTPVKADGSPDETRETIFFGHTQLISPNGPLPIQCSLEGKTIEEAIKNFPEAVNETVERMIAEAKEQQQKEDSRIIVPR